MTKASVSSRMRQGCGKRRCGQVVPDILDTPMELRPRSQRLGALRPGSQLALGKLENVDGLPSVVPHDLDPPLTQIVWIHLGDEVSTFGEAELPRLLVIGQLLALY